MDNKKILKLIKALDESHVSFHELRTLIHDIDLQIPEWEKKIRDIQDLGQLFRQDTYRTHFFKVCGYDSKYRHVFLISADKDDCSLIYSVPLEHCIVGHYELVEVPEIA